MNTQVIWAAMATGLLSFAAHAECVYPRPPATTPDGATATEEQMVAGMKAVRQYNEEVNTYLTCLEQEMNARVEAAGPDAPVDQIESIRAIHSKRHNAAVEELEAHAARFNEQVKAYKAREKKS